MFNFHLCFNNSLDFYGCFGEPKSFLCSAFTGNSYCFISNKSFRQCMKFLTLNHEKGEGL